jgi:hypothetical protein
MIFEIGLDWRKILFEDLMKSKCSARLLQILRESENG